MSQLHDYILAMDDAGNLKVQHRIAGDSLSIGPERGDVDVHAPDLRLKDVLVARSGDGFVFSADGGQPQKISRGEAYQAGGWTWWFYQSSEDSTQVVSREGDDASSFGTDQQSFQLLRGALAWSSQVTGEGPQLHAELESFLSLVGTVSGSIGEMLVLYEEHGHRLLTQRGLTKDVAEKLLKKIPDTVQADVVREEVRMILLQEMQDIADQSTSTLFVPGVKSIVGFPVVAEQRVLGLLFLSFENIVTSLPPGMQSSLSDACGLCAQVILKALLREQIHSQELLVADTHSSRLMIGQSNELNAVYQQINRLGSSQVSILIHGETGVGKELAARELHRHSTRPKGPFIAVNAAALPESLIESELFGHKKGSFTGATSDRIGLIEQADGGTLFIDEIGELPLHLQPKLLRVLQERIVQRVGETKTRSVDFRLVAATHRDLREMVGAKEFREDLFFRVAGARIDLPALRERRQDIPLLAQFFLQRFRERHGMQRLEFSKDALAGLKGHSWPGNIRELQNVVERAAILSEGKVIRADNLGTLDAEGASSDSYQDVDNLGTAKDLWMKEHICRVLDQNDWNKKQTAKALGIGLRTLFRHIEQLGIGDSTATNDAPNAVA